MRVCQPSLTYQNGHPTHSHPLLLLKQQPHMHVSVGKRLALVSLRARARKDDARTYEKCGCEGFLCGSVRAYVHAESPFSVYNLYNGTYTYTKSMMRCTMWKEFVRTHANNELICERAIVVVYLYIATQHQRNHPASSPSAVRLLCYATALIAPQLFLCVSIYVSAHVLYTSCVVYIICCVEHRVCICENVRRTDIGLICSFAGWCSFVWVALSHAMHT